MTDRINRSCRHFPCHEVLQDCTFCYCPFYPCGDGERGEYVTGKDGEDIWSCADCDWIHRRDVVDAVFKMIRKHRRAIEDLYPPVDEV